MLLVGKVALVTGGTLGLGAAMVRHLAKAGADVAIIARNIGEEAAQLAAELKALGRRALLISADMAQADECTRVIEQTAKEFGRLDVLIHNAGGPAFGNIEEVTPELWLETMNLHVNANYYLSRAALPYLKQQSEGAIIMVSSSAGVRGVPGAVAYATAKGALPQMTRTLARDLAQFNIRVNCIAPGIIRTRFHSTMTEERKKFNIENRIPLGREGTPDQVAEAVMLLVTNDYITGETLVIDGGLTSRIV